MLESIRLKLQNKKRSYHIKKNKAPIAFPELQSLLASPQPMQIRPIAVQDGLGGAVGDDLAFFEPDNAGAEFLDDLDHPQKLSNCF